MLEAFTWDKCSDGECEGHLNNERQSFERTENHLKDLMRHWGEFYFMLR